MKDRGLDIQVEFDARRMEHPNTARIVTEDHRGRTMEILGASVGGGNIEIRQVNGMEVSFACDYPTVLVFHRDRPGVISRVTGILAEEGINIAFMRVFRSLRHENACMSLRRTERPGRLCCGAWRRNVKRWRRCACCEL